MCKVSIGYLKLFSWTYFTWVVTLKINQTTLPQQILSCPNSPQNGILNTKYLAYPLRKKITHPKNWLSLIANSNKAVSEIFGWIFFCIKSRPGKRFSIRRNSNVLVTRSTKSTSLTKRMQVSRSFGVAVSICVILVLANLVKGDDESWQNPYPYYSGAGGNGISPARQYGYDVPAYTPNPFAHPGVLPGLFFATAGVIHFEKQSINITSSISFLMYMVPSSSCGLSVYKYMGIGYWGRRQK